MRNLQANSNLSKDNKISINKQSLGGGKINAYKINDYIFSNNNFIDFDTTYYSNYLEEYSDAPANPYQISFNVNLPKKPKQVQVNLKSIRADDVRYMGIVLTNPSNKPCYINQYEGIATLSTPLITAANINALVTDDAENFLFRPSGTRYLDMHITGQPYTITGVYTFPVCKPNFVSFGYIQTNPTCPLTLTMSGIDPITGSQDGITGYGASRPFYYTQLNKLIDNNYNGTWKISSWNYWNGDPGDVENGIYSGIDLIFKF